MNAPRVVQVGKFYPPHMGGIETHLKNLCRELAKEFRVDALVAHDDRRGAEEMDGAVLVRRLGTPFQISSAPVCPALITAIREGRPDLVHVHLPNPIAALAALASGYQGPLVVTYHSDVVRQKLLGAAFEPFLKLLLWRSDAIICTSQRYLDSSPVLAGFREKCVVIPYGIPVTRMSAAEPDDVQAIRKRFGDRLILAVGRLVYYKGFKHLVEAMAAVDGTLLLVGDGPLCEPLAEQVCALGLGRKVIMLGEIQNDELAPYYQAADLFALPSVARSEAFGIVQLEAMACGLPVVNTDLDSGVPFVSRHGETGLTVPPEDAPALARALNMLLDDPYLRARYANAARRRVMSEFTVETMAARTSNLYASLAPALVRKPAARAAVASVATMRPEAKPVRIAS